jgi:hypothetical protein
MRQRYTGKRDPRSAIRYPPERVERLSTGSGGSRIAYSRIAFLPNEVEHRLAKIVRLERLGDESVGAAFVGTASRFFLGVSGQDYDWKLASCRLRANRVEHLPSIHAGESDVEDNEVGRLGGHCFEPSGAILPGDDFDIAGPQANLD